MYSFDLDKLLLMGIAPVTWSGASNTVGRNIIAKWTKDLTCSVTAITTGSPTRSRRQAVHNGTTTTTRSASVSEERMGCQWGERSCTLSERQPFSAVVEDAGQPEVAKFVWKVIIK